MSVSSPVYRHAVASIESPGSHERGAHNDSTCIGKRKDRLWGVNVFLVGPKANSLAAHVSMSIPRNLTAPLPWIGRNGASCTAACENSGGQFSRWTAAHM